MLELSHDSFLTLIEGETPTLVDFWAPWCMPCRVFAPVLEDLSDELDGQVEFAKLNIDDHPDLATKYGIASIPTPLNLNTFILRIADSLRSCLVSKPSLNHSCRFSNRESFHCVRYFPGSQYRRACTYRFVPLRVNLSIAQRVASATTGSDSLSKVCPNKGMNSSIPVLPTAMATLRRKP